MTQKCNKCSKLNPAEAVYCYNDGNLLGGHTVNGGPIQSGTHPFPTPFVFASGLACRNFDQLVVACQENWDDAVKTLQQGFLEGFLGGLGRADLALAARQAARFPDASRGLDQLLARIPSQVLQPPKLHVEPREINLGQLRVGEDRQVDLHLVNRGTRLLYGTVTCENCLWLSLGDAAGAQQKIFQFSTDMLVKIRVLGKQLRASGKPLEGRLVVESNGGKFTVPIRAEIPVIPFSEGILAGARTPRQIAEKSKDHPKEATPFFEQGAVSRWYAANGWIYPVQGPSASGLGAVQQFFEALGLTQAPKVEISDRVINLVGKAGEMLWHSVEVKSREKRPVYAHATCDQDWVKVGPTRLNGRIATLPLVVTAVPNRPGATLQAELKVTANGNQQFSIPIALAVVGAPLPGAQVADAVVVPAAASAPSPATAMTNLSAKETPVIPGKKRVDWRNLSIHLLPALFLALALFGIVIRDFSVQADAADEPPIDTTPRIAVRFQVNTDNNFDSATMRFGIVMLTEKDPKNPNRPKRLTYAENGLTNNTCLRVDGDQRLFGDNRGKRKRRFDPPLGEWLEPKTPLGDSRQGWKSIWYYPGEKIQVTQIVEIVPGEQSRLFDTCVVRYLIDNQDELEHKVGLRFLLDTFIGANDGVPFTIPGAKDLCDTSMEFDSPEDVPDFIEALEFDNLSAPGTVAHVKLKLGGRIERPSRVTLGAWPNRELPNVKLGPKPDEHLTLWEVPVLPIKTMRDADSAVTIYWNERMLKAHETREVGFAYGLGNIASGEGKGKLAVTIDGDFSPEGIFTLTAYVREPGRGETVSLKLPQGFRIERGGETQKVPSLREDSMSKNSPVTWRVRAPAKRGAYSLRVESSTGVAQSQKVIIRKNSIFE